jgi:DNA-binding SARP family transcriptional activator
LITPQAVQFNLNSDCRLDVTHFRELLRLVEHHRHLEAASCEVCAQWLGQAAELYRGDLLTGLFVPDSVAFEEWRLVQQEILHRQALDTLRQLSVYYERRGKFDQVQEYARRQIALEPWSEEAYLQLMRALVQNRQTSAALKQYEIYQSTLVDELGINPSAEITAFYEHINSGKPVQLEISQPRTGETAWLSSQGERKQVTALVCSRSIEADPEELHAQLSKCEQHCEGIFNRFGGRRAVRQGESCLVYFGYPQAYEDAARRAVHSALAVAAALGKDGGVRIGIHTGIMTVGEKRGRRWQDRDLIGKAPEIASDCLRFAGSGEVIITKETQHLVQDAFDLQARRSQVAGTQEQSADVYHVRGESSSQSRLEWLAQTQRLPALTGRQEELAQLRASHEKILHGKGQVIILRGESGIGKSRLVWELEKSVPIVGVPITGEQKNLPPVLWITGRCLPYNQNTGLYPIIGLLEGLLGFQTGDSSDIRREKLKRILSRYQLNRPLTIWLLSLLIGLPTDAPHPETITKAQREQMRQVFIALLQKYAAEQPLVLVIEDLHWSDPSTIEWLGQSLDSLASIPCLTLLTARPGFNPVWLAQQNLNPALLMLSLSPLQPEQAEAMVMNLAGDNILDENIRRTIVRQTDGVPLYLEELTRVVLERRITKANVNKLAEIPATLLDSLVARLDHLGKTKETAYKPVRPMMNSACKVIWRA